MLKDYRYINMSESKRESEKIMQSLCRKLWKDSGYETAYWLGAINQLKFIAQSLKGSNVIDRRCCLELMKTLKATEDMPNEVENLIDIILNEFKDKEKQK